MRAAPRIVANPDLHIPYAQTLETQVIPQVNHIVAAARVYQLEPALLHAVISAESGYEPLARSPKGARGLMQLMPGTAADMAVNNPFDAKQNIRGGTQYLALLLKQFSCLRS